MVFQFYVLIIQILAVVCFLASSLSSPPPSPSLYLPLPPSHPPIYLSHPPLSFFLAILLSFFPSSFSLSLPFPLILPISPHNLLPFLCSFSFFLLSTPNLLSLNFPKLSPFFQPNSPYCFRLWSSSTSQILKIF